MGDYGGDPSHPTIFSNGMVAKLPDLQSQYGGVRKVGVPQSSPWVSILSHGLTWMIWGNYSHDLGNLHFSTSPILVAKSHNIP